MRLLILLLSFLAALPAQPKKISVIAHRGEHLHHPENTIPAFQGAVDAGADYFELDVRKTADGKYVLMHDGTVDRMTNGKGEVAKMTFDEIRRLDARGCSVPTFDEALEFARNHGIGVYIDSKSISAEDAVAAVERHQMQNRVVVYGASGYLKQIAALRPSMKLMPEARSAAVLLELIQALRLKVAAFDANDFKDATIAVAKKAGLDIFVDRLGAADTPVSWQDAIDRGATGIQTDRPAELAAYLKSKGYR